MSDNAESKTKVSRRALLRGAALSAGAAGAAATGLISTGHDAKAAADGQNGTGYRETEHVRRAYEAAGF